ncbi:hypothetical protein D9M72_521500 [compost metagenome]
MVDIGNGGAVAALHVVSEDLELRLCREIGIVRKQERVARHLRVGLLCVLGDQDLALEHALGAVENDVADDLRRRRVRYIMAEREGHVRVAFTTEQVDAAQLEIRALAARLAVDLLAHQLAAGIDDEEMQLGVLAEVEAELAEMGIGNALLLQDDPDDVGAFRKRHVADRRDEALAGIGRKMPLDHGCLGVGAEGDREARMRLAEALHQLDFQRIFQSSFSSHVDFETAADKTAIDAADRVVKAEHGEAGGRRTVEQAVDIGTDGHAIR